MLQLFRIQDEAIIIYSIINVHIMLNSGILCCEILSCRRRNIGKRGNVSLLLFNMHSIEIAE